MRRPFGYEIKRSLFKDFNTQTDTLLFRVWGIAGCKLHKVKEILKLQILLAKAMAISVFLKSTDVVCCRCTVRRKRLDLNKKSLKLVVIEGGQASNNTED